MKESTTALLNTLSILRFRLAITCSRTVRLQRLSWSMQSCGYCPERSGTNYLLETILSAGLARNAAIHQTGRISRLESSGRFAFRKSRGDRSLAREGGAQTH